MEGRQVVGVSHWSAVPRDVDVKARPPADAHPIAVSVLGGGEEGSVVIAMERDVEDAGRWEGLPLLLA